MSWIPYESPEVVRADRLPSIKLQKNGRSYSLRINQTAARLAKLKAGDLVAFDRQNGQRRIRKVGPGDKNAIATLLAVKDTEAVLCTTGGTILKNEGYASGEAAIVLIFDGSIVFNVETLPKAGQKDIEPRMGRPRKDDSK